MGNFEKNTIIDSAFLLIRRLLACTIIVVIAVLAIFWESLPASIKNAITSFSTTQADNNGGSFDDDTIPHRFRIENNPENREIIPLQLSQPAQSANWPSIPERNGRVTETQDSRYTQTENTPLDETALTRLHEELKQLGVTSCQLTYWGDKRNMFRFSCQVPISEHNPSTTRTFQSIAPEATQSMQEVIDQVRQWQSTRFSL